MLQVPTMNSKKMFISFVLIANLLISTTVWSFNYCSDCIIGKIAAFADFFPSITTEENTHSCCREEQESKACQCEGECECNSLKVDSSPNENATTRAKVNFKIDQCSGIIHFSTVFHSLSADVLIFNTFPSDDLVSQLKKPITIPLRV